MEGSQYLKITVRMKEAKIVRMLLKSITLMSNSNIKGLEGNPSLLVKYTSMLGFVVRRDAAITVMKTDNFGVLVDKILALGVYKINKAEWKPLT